MIKYKIGDKVRVRTFNKRPVHWNCMGEMDKWVGEKVKISKIDNDIYRIVEDGNFWGWHKSDFEEIVVFNFLEDEDVLL